MPLSYIPGPPPICLKSLQDYLYQIEFKYYLSSCYLENNDKGKSQFLFSTDAVFFPIVLIRGWLNLQIQDLQICVVDCVCTFYGF